MKLWKPTDPTSNLGTDLELSETIESVLVTSEVESEAELGIRKEGYPKPEGHKPLANKNCLREYYQEKLI